MRGRVVCAVATTRERALIGHISAGSLPSGTLSGDNICNLDHVHTSRIIMDVGGEERNAEADQLMRPETGIALEK